MTFKTTQLLRAACLLLSLCLLGGCLISCSGADEVPDGYQYATCAGEYFRLFVPTQWTSNVESGISGAYISIDTSVTMCEIAFTPLDNGTPDDDGSRDLLNEFCETHIDEVSALRDYKQESRFGSNVSGYKAQNLTYTATVAGIPVKYRQMMVKAEGRYYLFTYAAPAEKFEIYEDIVSEIIDSIQFYATPYEGDGVPTRKVPEGVNTPDGMRLISTNEVAFRFYAPEAWETDPSSVLNLVYVTEEDGSKSNVTMTAYMPEDEGYSVADYWDMVKVQYGDTLKDFTVTYTTDGTDEEAKLGGRNATVYEFTYTLGGVTYKTRQTMCVYSTMVYIMTYTALPAYFDAHTADVARMEAELVFRAPFDGN